MSIYYLSIINVQPKIHQIESLSNKFYHLASKHKRSAAGIAFICLKDKSIFLCLRSQHVTFSNNWGIPGGKVESGESAIDAAIREVTEELGSSPDVAGCEVIDAIIFNSPNLNYTTFIISLSPEEKETWKPVLNKEHTKCDWFAVDKLPENLHPGVKQSLEVISKMFQQEVSDKKEDKVEEEKSTPST